MGRLTRGEVVRVYLCPLDKWVNFARCRYPSHPSPWYKSCPLLLTEHLCAGEGSTIRLTHPSTVRAILKSFPRSQTPKWRVPKERERGPTDRKTAVRCSWKDFLRQSRRMLHHVKAEQISELALLSPHVCFCGEKG